MWKYRHDDPVGSDEHKGGRPWVNTNCVVSVGIALAEPVEKKIRCILKTMVRIVQSASMYSRPRPIRNRTRRWTSEFLDISARTVTTKEADRDH